MDCKTKQMNSYQRLKWELNETYKALNHEKEIRLYYSHALYEISKLKNKDINKASLIAQAALLEYINK